MPPDELVEVVVTVVVVVAVEARVVVGRPVVVDVAEGHLEGRGSWSPWR